jgi:hypothetical protein
MEGKKMRMPELFFTKKRNRKGRAIQNETIVSGWNGHSVIHAAIYQISGEPEWHVDLEAKAVGRFDSRFSRHDIASYTEAVKYVKTI